MQVYRTAKLKFAVCEFRASLVECGRRPARGGLDAAQSDSASDATETYFHTRRPPPCGLLCSMCNCRAEDPDDRTVLFKIKAVQLYCSPLSLES